VPAALPGDCVRLRPAQVVRCGCVLQHSATHCSPLRLTSLSQDKHASLQVELATDVIAHRGLPQNM
jgi:hypothetical protein